MRVIMLTLCGLVLIGAGTSTLLFGAAGWAGASDRGAMAGGVTVIALGGLVMLIAALVSRAPEPLP